MSAKGTPAFIAVRATSVLLLPFVVWFIWSVLAHAGDDHTALRAWLSQPLIACLFAAFLVLSAAHMRLGFDEVIEDYIHDGWRVVLRAANTLVALAVAALAFYSAYILAFAG